MADEDEQLDGAPEGEEVEGEEAAAKESGGKKSLLLKILTFSVGGLLLLIIMILISVVVANVVASSGAEKIEPVSSVIKKPPLTPWEPLGEFNVALAPGGDGKTHFIQTKIVPAYDSSNKKILNELNRRRFELRDIVTSILAKKRYSDLVGSDGKDRLIKDLMAKFNNVLIHGQIKALYLPKYVVQ